MVDWEKRPILTRAVLWGLLALLIVGLIALWYPADKMAGIGGVILRSCIEAGIVVSCVLLLVAVWRGIVTLKDEKEK